MTEMLLPLRIWLAEKHTSKLARKRINLRPRLEELEKTANLKISPYSGVEDIKAAYLSINDESIKKKLILERYKYDKLTYKQVKENLNEYRLKFYQIQETRWGALLPVLIIGVLFVHIGYDKYGAEGGIIGGVLAILWTINRQPYQLHQKDTDFQTAKSEIEDARNELKNFKPTFSEFEINELLGKESK
jgi:hypothetical protein